MKIWVSRPKTNFATNIAMEFHFPYFLRIQKQGARTQTLGSGYLPVRWGLPREEVWAKKFVMSLATQGKQIFRRDIPGSWLGYPGVPEKFEKKKFNVWSLIVAFGGTIFGTVPTIVGSFSSSGVRDGGQLLMLASLVSGFSAFLLPPPCR